MNLTLHNFSMVDFIFKPWRRLKRIDRLITADFITEVVRDLPETTTCEGNLRDPRCPVSGNGDVTNILLGAYNKRGELKGALHFGAINLIEKKDNILVVETHPTPAFPEMNVTEMATFILRAVKFLLGSNLLSEEGSTLQIRGINYALEIPFTKGGKFEAIHNEMIKEGLDFSTTDDPVRVSRKLYSIKLPLEP